MTDYNGYKNRATWLVSLWINNDYCLYLAMKSVKPTIEDVKDFILNHALYCCNGFNEDMKTVKIKDVDWIEVINSYYDE